METKTSELANRENNSSNEQSGISAPTISLPKGGGSIRGIGEKFAANPVTGTGAMSVPIATSPGRSGFGPQLSLSYDSGSGNGPFGFGWSLSLPAITRKTEKGLPRYYDGDDADVFILSGAEDLVPEFERDAAGDWVIVNGRHVVHDTTRSVNGLTYNIRRYRPRVEGLFARIERWTEQQTGTSHWRSISRDNITTLYGRDNNSRIFDPADADPVHPTRIFSWLICESYDDKGNHIVYDYKAEDSLGVDQTQTHEKNRTDSDRATNRYLKHIYYGNKVSRLAPADPARSGWMFEVVFDYSDGHYAEELPDADGNVFARAYINSTEDSIWPARPDPFSTYRASFEIRTYRLCQRVLMFHHFAAELETNDYLVRSTDLSYDSNPTASFITRVTQSGYQLESGQYLKKSLPPLEFSYSQIPTVDQLAGRSIQAIDAESLENLPQGLDNTAHQWVDLDGEGLSGILTEQADAWFYKRNLGEGNFGPLERVAAKPSLAALNSGRQQLLDLAGDGQIDLVTFAGPTPGFYERALEESWDNHKSFKHLPNIAWDDPNLRFVDLNGDGHADVLVTEGDVFSWYPSLAEDGFDRVEQVAQPRDEERGPRSVYSDGTQSIYLADMSGDGLADLVRIQNGEVCYWPNLGYGRFGAKVNMDNAPWFDHPDQFDQRCIRLADIDGSGLIDILYLGNGGVRFFYNQSGNRWSDVHQLPQFPRTDDLSSVQVLDLLGNGTACLVWSSPLPGEARMPLRYIDLMGAQKPHLLILVKNNLGAETEIHYVSSTKFYLADKSAGKPWVTRLPFPVHCVEKVTRRDRWRQTTLSMSYSYHHGYFEGIEREFRGFGRVEQVDVETFGAFAAGNAASPYITDDRTLYQPPVKTVTWYHTGAMLDRERILSQFSDEYFPNWFEAENPDRTNVLGSFQENDLSEPDLEAEELSTEEWREALRACKGMLLRQEVYELDVDALEAGEHRPVKLFSTAYHNCHIQRLQEKVTNPYAVFLVIESEAVIYNYELDLRSETVRPDPRVAHTLNLNVDEYGNVLQSIAVVYTRFGRHVDATLPAGVEDRIAQMQKETHLAYTETFYTNDVLTEDDYRLRVPCEVKTFELTGIELQDEEDRTTADPRDDRCFTLAELRRFRLSETYQAGGVAVPEIPYHELPTRASPQKRLVETARTVYFAESLDGPLPFGALNRLGLTYEVYKLALTDDLLSAIFTPDQLTDEIRVDLSNPAVSGYLSGPELTARFPEAAGQYWLRSGTAGFESDAAGHFYLPERYTDPFGNLTHLRFDPYDLFLESSIDPAGNTSRVEGFDFRTVAPRVIRDINDNLSEVLFDVLGMPVAMALRGKGSEGDNLDGFDDELLNPGIGTLTRFFTSDYDEAEARRLLGNATARYIYYLGESTDAEGVITYGVHPACVCGIVREKHVARLEAGEVSPLQVGFEYSDGAGAVLVKKAQAEPEEGSGSLRWLATGKTILNNKGKPVKQYEPYFSPNAHRFEETVEAGVTPVMYYDASGRLIRTEQPDGSYSRVGFSPWHATNYDANDTVLEPGNIWYAQRTTPAAGEEERRAAQLAAGHADTPGMTFLDSLGREVMSVTHNKYRDRDGVDHDEKYTTFTKLDAEGKPLWIRDTRGNLVMQYITPLKPTRTIDEADPTNPEDVPAGTVPCYDIAGNLLFQHSMDAGRRWSLTNAAGKSMYGWDVNDRATDIGDSVLENRIFHTSYDALHRPLEQRLKINEGPWQIIERFVYGDWPALDETDSKRRNLRGQAIQHYDPSGLATNVNFDFKGNLLETRRQLASNYQAAVIDWSDATAGLETETFTKITEYDALNRMTRLYNWHADLDRVAVYEPRYNQRGLLEAEDIVVGATKTSSAYIGGSRTTAIVDVAHNAKGQRERIQYGNGTTTRYEYDPLTFKLWQLRTTRAGYDPIFPGHHATLRDAQVVQQLYYTYDPVGNITEIHDDAYEPVFFSNQRVEPRSQYTYDALYRLITSRGRENYSAETAPGQFEELPFFTRFSIGDHALRNYAQYFTYDSAGNIEQLQHTAARGSWTRDYEYAGDSNRLLRTWTGGDEINAVRYNYDRHGSMLNLSNVSTGDRLHWDYRDMIQGINVGGGTAHYNYDAGKQRTRKVIANRAGVKHWEHIYLGGMEIHRRYGVTGSVLEEIETHHLFVDDQRVLLIEDVLEMDDDTLGVGTLFRYQYGNHLGSVGLELNAEGGIISYEEYHPYGTSAYRARNGEVRAAAKRYRYTGMEHDEESGLNYHTARYYAPWLGRWVSGDPAGVASSLNLYECGYDNPMIFNDPSGRQPPPVGPIREGMLIGDSPGLSARWQQAAEGVLERRYGGGSYEVNLRRFQQQIQRLERLGLRGSNRTPGTAIYTARRVFTRINRAFRHLVDLPEATQIHHAFEGLAENPAGSLNAAGLEIATGHATVAGTTHHRAHRATDLHREGVGNPGVQATREMEAARGAGSTSPGAPAAPDAPATARAPVEAPTTPPTTAAAEAHPPPRPVEAPPPRPAEPPPVRPAEPPPARPTLPEATPNPAAGERAAARALELASEVRGLARLIPLARATARVGGRVLTGLAILDLGYTLVTRGPGGVSEMFEETITLPFVIVIEGSIAVGEELGQIMERGINWMRWTSMGGR